MIWFMAAIFCVVALLCWLVYCWSSDLQKEIVIARKQLDTASQYFQTGLRVAEEDVKNKFGKCVSYELFQKLAMQVADDHELKSLKREIELLQVRQRTLEKRIIGGERTINLNIIDPKNKSKPLLDRAGVKTKGHI